MVASTISKGGACGVSGRAHAPAPINDRTQTARRADGMPQMLQEVPDAGFTLKQRP
jgi:hypothetical protein